jgi:hypothetical protein
MSTFLKSSLKEEHIRSVNGGSRVAQRDWK